MPKTISNLYLAIGNDLEIIPVINKIDMDGAMIEEVEDQIVELIGCKREDILRASGRTGIGVEAILEAIVERIPSPSGNPDAPLQALIFDSVFNSFQRYYCLLPDIKWKYKKRGQSKVCFHQSGVSGR